MASFENYEEVRKKALEAIDLGNLNEAVDYYSETITIAEELDDKNLRARALSNLAGVEIARGNIKEFLPDLQRILGTIKSPMTSHLAAYNLAFAYYRLKDYRKGLFYLKMALKVARDMDFEEGLGTCHNLKASIEIAEGNAAEAIEDYYKALARLPEGDSVARGMVLDNLGYSMVVMGKLDEGLDCLLKSQKMLQSLNAEYALIFLNLDLAYTYLEIGKPKEALDCAQKALREAEVVEEQETLVNALYLCGEAALGTNMEDTARFYFERVQDIYPKAPMLTEFLMQIDIRSLINLKA